MSTLKPSGSTLNIGDALEILRRWCTSGAKKTRPDAVSTRFRYVLEPVKQRLQILV